MAVSRYRDRLAAMVDELESHPEIVVDDLEWGEPARDEDLARIDAMLPDGLADFASQVGSFELAWHLPPRNGDPPDVYGAVRLLPITRIFGDWKGQIWFEEEWSPAALRRIRPFDFFADEACAALYPVPGSATIHYHYCGEALHPTGLDFAAWFDRLVAARCFWYWITATCARLRSSVEVARLRRWLPALFPDVDMALFQPTTADGPVDV